MLYHGIELSIEGEIIGYGNFKVPVDCYKIWIPLDKREPVIPMEPAVLDFLTSSIHRDLILNSVKEQERLRKTIDPKYRDNIQDLSVLTTTPELILQGKWYPSDLDRLAKTYRIQPNRHSKKAFSISLIHILEVVHQVSTTLLLIHDQGDVHRDVKPKNIFVEIKDVKIFSVLADFDGIAKIGEKKFTFCSPIYTSNSYYKNREISTPQDDTIALVTTLGETALEEFKKRIHSKSTSREYRKDKPNIEQAITDIRTYLLENSDEILLESVKAHLKRKNIIPQERDDLSDIKSSLEELFKSPTLNEAKKKELHIVLAEINAMEAVSNLVCDFIKRDLNAQVVTLLEFRHKLKVILLTFQRATQ
ncbi:MAG: hypothetical protein HZB76_04510 [Chlamydiae bacterium]|nr:hypothetical protein [Chlamydiota bacterium]